MSTYCHRESGRTVDDRNDYDIRSRIDADVERTMTTHDRLPGSKLRRLVGAQMPPATLRPRICARSLASVLFTTTFMVPTSRFIDVVVPNGTSISRAGASPPSKVALTMVFAGRTLFRGVARRARTTASIPARSRGVERRRFGLKTHHALIEERAFERTARGFSSWRRKIGGSASGRGP